MHSILFNLSVVHMFVYGYHGCLCVIPVKLTPLLKFSINLQAVETVIVKRKTKTKVRAFYFCPLFLLMVDTIVTNENKGVPSIVCLSEQ